MEQLLNGVGDLVTTETDKAEVLNVFFAFVFHQQGLPMPVLTDRVQGGKGWPSVDDDLVRNCLTELDPYKVHGITPAASKGTERDGQCHGKVALSHLKYHGDRGGS